MVRAARSHIVVRAAVKGWQVEGTKNTGAKGGAGTKDMAEMVFLTGQNFEFFMRGTGKETA